MVVLKPAVELLAWGMGGAEWPTCSGAMLERNNSRKNKTALDGNHVGTVSLTCGYME